MKAKNNKRNLDMRECQMCHTITECDTHEAYGGISRQDSIKYGYQVPLCRKCHRLVTINDTRGIIYSKIWKQQFQLKREIELRDSGMTPLEARAVWMSEMGRNYLEVIK